MFINLLSKILLSIVASGLCAEHHVIDVLKNSKSRIELGSFIDNVLRQVPSQSFFQYINQKTKNRQFEDDGKLYAHLQKDINSIKSLVPILPVIQALRFQQTLLTRQARSLLGKNRIFNGCIEIGTPGTYMSPLSDIITGPTYALYEKQSLSDYIQSFAFKPSNGFLAFKTFIPLNDYTPIDSKQVPDQSVDLVICYIGLHHIPREKIEAFVASIARVLRPGGVFLLRDHDAYSAEMVSLVSAAHWVFNLILANEPLENELKEYRNFQPLSYWKAILEKHGFEIGPETQLQKGDTTLNTMMKCIKKAQNHEDHLSQLKNELAKNPDYQRDGMQALLTGPEWYNVDSAQEYGAFIEHTPFYEYPYLQDVKTYWDVFKKSWDAAAKKNGHLSVAFSPYTLMNLFVGCSMSVEYAAKAALSYPIHLMYSGEEAKNIQLLMQKTTAPESFDSRIKVLSSHGDVVHIEMPRYKVFNELLHTMAQHPENFKIIEIAGNKQIQVKIMYPKAFKNQLKSFAGVSVEYDWHIKTKPHHEFAILSVSVEQLLETLQRLQQSGFTVLYVHDF
jgi:hypothetical protein